MFKMSKLSIIRDFEKVIQAKQIKSTQANENGSKIKKTKFWSIIMPWSGSLAIE